MPKVSIIIPFNNVENYIEQCLDSVLSQTLEDIEVILVNDASVDKSRTIVQKYQKKDKRIKVIDIKERKGQGFARNRAIEIATGEYIGFVDSDDFVEKDMFEVLYKKAKSDDTDITMCQVREYDDINEYYISSDYYSLEPLITFADDVFSAEDTKEQVLDINVALWNKIYKREYLNKIGEKFPEGFIYEDLPFFFGTYLPAKRINIVWQNLYSYRVNRKNSTMQQFNDKILDRLPMVSLTFEKLKEVKYLSSLKQRIQAWIINDLFHRYTLLKESYHKEFFFLMKKVFENLEIENIQDDYWKKVYHFKGYLLVINNSFEAFNQKVFNEYLEIHKIEDRIQSQIVGIDEIDRRFGLIYDDLSKVYKYSENIVNAAKDELVQNINVDEKISKVYEEITKNYEYTNSLKAELQEEYQEEISNHLEEKYVQVSSEIDEKISKVYEEITKNYEYTNGLKDELQTGISKQLEETYVQVNSVTDEKISKVYEEITKNYEYTNNLKDELQVGISQQLEKTYVQVNSETDEKISKVYEKITKNDEHIKRETDEKILKVYEEITKNYEYTNGLKDELQVGISQQLEEKYLQTTNETNDKISKVYEEISKNYEFTKDLANNVKIEVADAIKETTKDLYNDIKDLSFVVQDNFVELNKLQDQYYQEYKYSVDTINQRQNYADEQVSTLHSKIENIAVSLEKVKENNRNSNQELVQKIESEKVQSEKIVANLKNEFLSILKEREEKHEKEVLELKEQIKDLEYKLREEMKSPLKKLVEKYQAKQVK